MNLVKYKSIKKIQILKKKYKFTDYFKNTYTDSEEKLPYLNKNFGIVIIGY